MTHDHDKDLDALFADARDAKPALDLMARVLADAGDVQAERSRKIVAAPRSSWLAIAIAAIGGWSAVSGITAAGVMGLAVGLYSPDTVAGWLGDEALGTYELSPDLGGLWTEDGDV